MYFSDPVLFCSKDNFFDSIFAAIFDTSLIRDIVNNLIYYYFTKTEKIVTNVRKTSTLTLIF